VDLDQKDNLQSERADGWKDFHNEFSKLAIEEADIVRARVKDDYLIASCTYKRDAVMYERGRPEKGPFCLLKMPECGIWNVSSGVSENFQERFRTLAVRAGLALGCPEDTHAEDFWLHLLFQDLLENRSRLLFAAKKGEGGMIRRVCEASATFCTRLERKATKLESKKKPIPGLEIFTHTCLLQKALPTQARNRKPRRRCTDCNPARMRGRANLSANLLETLAASSG